MVLHQFDYIFAIGIIFAFLDAWNIGANDVANSFATSVSSRSLTMKQALLIATVMEFLGAVLCGARVADTIRTKILDITLFKDDPAMLMLAMTCALIGSSTYLTIATRIGMPISTTHSIMGGVLGAGIAAIGANGVNWGIKGVSQVFLAWVIAPAIAGAFGAIIFNISKYSILKRKNPVRAGLTMLPIFFAFTAGVLAMVIVWKGAPALKLDKWNAAQILSCIFGVAVAVGLLSAVFLVPYLHRRLELNDWQLRPWHILQGPLLLRRGEVPPQPEGTASVVTDYYAGHKTTRDLEIDGLDRKVADDLENNTKADPAIKERTLSSGSSDEITGETCISSTPANHDHKALICERCLAKPEEAPIPWYRNPEHRSFKGAWRLAKKAFFHGVNIDIVEEQRKSSKLAGSNLESMHARAEHFDNRAETIFSPLQVLTAATASFAHGSNDVSNAIGPLATIFLIWNSGELASKAPVPIWVLVFGGAAIVIGLWTYGFNVMRNLGNRLTLHSPSRGFSMEFGSALTVVMATRLSLPVSTTQCISGATVGVGLCMGSVKGVNWRLLAWIYGSWIITLPVTGIISGCLMGIIINAPRWGLGA